MTICKQIFMEEDSNYKSEIDLLILSDTKIREISNYNNEISISMNEGFIEPDEL